MKNLAHYINGQQYAGRSGREATGFDPALGLVISNVPLGNKEDVSLAVLAAQEAFASWSQVPPVRRARVLFDFKSLLERNAHELAALITLEHGKTLAEAHNEVRRGIEAVEFACGVPQLLKGHYTEQAAPGVDNWTLREPVGVVAAITPYGLPMLAPCWMFPLAIACGNAVVLKPSERTPSIALRLAELFVQAGLPGGVLNVLFGDKQAVDALIDHDGVQAVSFAGSTPVAVSVYAHAAQRGKRAQAMGSAKNHAVVMPDADLDRAADALAASAYGCGGEGGLTVSVVVAVGGIADGLVERLAERARNVVVGNGAHAATVLGPLISAQHRAQAAAFVEDGVAAGARLVVDGRGRTVAGHPKGFYIGASLLDHVRPAMNVYREAILGPVLCVLRVADAAQAVALVNMHSFAHGVSCFTRDGGTARAFSRSVRAGIVGINIAAPAPMAWHAYGGAKQSLFGGRAVLGEDGVHFYTHTKTVVQGY
jgi:malonate-semialdehyde dehydrogenase (acetylating)/methylmalonate-semialdehyde dehydrogenase